MAKTKKIEQARMLVRYGHFEEGDTVSGPLAVRMVTAGMAKALPPIDAKMASKATENKAL